MEEAVIVLIVFGCFAIITKMVLDYAKEKHRMRASSAGSSLTSSELRAIIQQAVEEAMDEHFVRIEHRLESLSQPSLLTAHTEEADLEHVKPEVPPVERERDALK